MLGKASGCCLLGVVLSARPIPSALCPGVVWLRDRDLVPERLRWNPQETPSPKPQRRGETAHSAPHPFSCSQVTPCEIAPGCTWKSAEAKGAGPARGCWGRILRHHASVTEELVPLLYRAWEGPSQTWQSLSTSSGTYPAQPSWAHPAAGM